jgi:hypothetical protein
MAFKETEKVLIEAVVSAFVTRRRPPAHILEKLDYGFRLKGQSVELFEIRPKFNDHSVKLNINYAKATYVKTKKIWKVYWKRGTGEWWPYEPCKVKKIEDFIRLVEKDKDHCFFG